ncbi:MFS transporter [Nocardiopsis changdeensis]|uniref:MFS transporter n=1 Tax=Nocardiopsis changdeensis TaxID=2831969 RepID=UPI003F47EC15
MAAPGSALPPLGPGYRRLLAAGALGNLGDGIALVALPWYTATLTGDPVAVAAVAAAGRLPWLGALVAGAVGDRMDRRRLMVRAGAGKALVLVVLAALAAVGAAPVPVVVAAALLVGVCEVFFDNTAQSLMPMVVPRERLERANGMLWSVEEVAGRFAGAPLAGVLVAVSAAAAFGAQALLAAGAVGALLALRGDFTPAAGAGAAVPLRVLVGEGVRWLWGHRLLRTLAVVLGLSNLAASMNAAVLVLFARDVLGVGAAGFGLLLTAVSAGMVLGAQVVHRLVPLVAPGVALAAALAVQAVGYLLVGSVHRVWVFAVCFVAVGFFTMWWNVVTVSLRQRIVPGHLLSRVLAAYRTVGWGTAPVGALAAGGLAAALEPVVGRVWALSAPFLVAGVLSAALVAVSAARLTTRAVRAAEAGAGSHTRSTGTQTSPEAVDPSSP